MSFAFKKFAFFTQEDVPAHCCPKNATTYCPGASLLFVGCDNGTVQALDSTFQPVFSFAAHGYKVLELVWLQVGGRGRGCASY